MLCSSGRLWRGNDISSSPINASPCCRRTEQNTTNPHHLYYHTGFHSLTRINNRVLSESFRNTKRKVGRGRTAGSQSAVLIAGEASPEDSPAMSHAVLHDFCMNIPYGISMVALGIIGLAFAGAGKFGALVSAVGVVEIILSSMSLQGWKKGRKNTPWTLLGALCSSGLAYVSIELWRLAAYRMLSGSIGVLSVCISLFLVYNVLSGGNPPPSRKNA